MTELQDTKDDMKVIKDTAAGRLGLTTKITLGVSMVMAGLLLMLTMLTWNSVQTTNNLSDVLNRRSPIVEYLVCFNDKIIAQNTALNDLILLSPHRTPTPLDLDKLETAEQNLRVASHNIKEANTKGSDGACPNIP